MTENETNGIAVNIKADQNVSLFVTLLQGISHVCLYPVAFFFPIMLIQSAGVSVTDAISLSQLTLLTMGVATILMCIKPGIMGSGYLCPATACPSFFTASLIAAKTGGLALLSGMLIFTGVFQIIFSRILKYLKFLLKPEVMGVVVLMIGMTALTVTAPIFVGMPAPGISFDGKTFAIGVITFLIMLIPAFRKNEFWRRNSVLIGFVVGIAISVIFKIDNPLIDVPRGLAFVALPPIGGFGWSFEIALIPLFIIAALASLLKTAACVAACKELNNEIGKNESLKAEGGGMLSIGIANLVSGAVGGMGNSTAAGNIGLSLATGIASRKVGFTLGAILVLFSFSPWLAGQIIDIATPVVGACLLYVTSFMLVLAFRLLTAIAFDAKKIFTLGIALSFGFCVDIMPDLFKVGSSTIADRLNLATILAVLLSLVFLIGKSDAGKKG